LVDNSYTKAVVVNIAKDRVKLAYRSEKQVEVHHNLYIWYPWKADITGSFEG